MKSARHIERELQRMIVLFEELLRDVDAGVSVRRIRTLESALNAIAAELVRMRIETLK